MSLYAYGPRNNAAPPALRPWTAMETVPWGGITFNLPFKVESNANAIQRRHYFFSLLTQINSATNTLHANKIGVLTSRFASGTITLKEAHGHLSSMYDVTARQPRWSSPAFLISSPKLVGENGQPLAIPTATEAASIKVLPQCAFVRFNVTIDAKRVYPNCGTDKITFSAGVAVPEIVRENTVHPQITNVRDPLEVKSLLESIYRYTGCAPVVGTIKSAEAGAKYLECVPDLWSKRVEEHYLRCIFSILSLRLQQTFVGEVQDTTVQQDLTGCRQTTFDSSLRRTVQRTVTAYYEAFTFIVTGSPYDDDKPFPFDIGELFFAGANAPLINMFHSENKSLPLAPLGESVAEALLRLQAIKQLLIEAEGKLSVIDLQIQAHSQRPRANMIQAYTATPPRPSDHGAETTESGWQWYGPTQHTAAQYHNGGPYQQQQTGGQEPNPRVQVFQAAARDYDPNLGTEEDAWIDVAVFFSAAESALRRATKTSSAPPECWGCHGIPGLHENRYHLFKNCPHHAREDVRPNFFRRLKEYKAFMQKRSETGDTTTFYTPGDVTNTNENVPMIHSARWKIQGFPSAKFANLVASVATNSTISKARRGCLMALEQTMDQLRLEGGPEIEEQTKKVNWKAKINEDGTSEPSSEPRRKRQNRGHLFAVFARELGIHAFNLTAREQDKGGIHNYINISQNLPHIRLPIGPVSASPDDVPGSLLAMCDSGAGLNLGNLQYHTSCYKTAPHLVKSFFKFDEEGFDPIVIGGVGDEGDGGLRLTAIITYHLPFEMDGHPAHIAIGLAEGTTTNTIISYPFLRNMQAHVDHEHNTVTLNRIGLTLILFDQVPMRSETAPSSGGGNPQSFVARTRGIDWPSSE